MINKLIILISFFLISIYSSAFAALVEVQHVGYGAGTGTSATATVAATGSGNLLVVIVANTPGIKVTSVSDGTDNFTQFPNAYFNGSIGSMDLWYLAKSISGKTSMTVNFSGSSSFVDVEFWEVSGFNHPFPDVVGIISPFGVVSSTTATGAAVLTTGTTGFIVAGDDTAGGVTVNPAGGNEFSSGGNLFNTDGYCSLISSTAAIHQPAWTESTNGAHFNSITAAFKEETGTYIYNAKINNAKIAY